MSAEQIRDGFQHGKLDLALTTYPLIEPGIEWEQVLERSWCWSWDRSTLWLGTKRSALPSSKGVEIMCESLGGDLRTMVDRCCAKAGFHANVVLESDIGSAIGFHEGCAGQSPLCRPTAICKFTRPYSWPKSRPSSAHRRPPAGPGPNADHGGGREVGVYADGPGSGAV